MAAATATRPRTALSVSSARRWLKLNLFGSAFNSTLSILTIVFAAFVIYQLARFVLVDAEWAVIDTNRRLLALGRFPQDEEWRVWPPVWTLGALIGLSIGLWGRVSRFGLVIVIAVLAFLFGLMFEGTNALLAAVAVALGAAGYLATHYGRLGPTATKRARRAVFTGWVALLPLTVVLLLVADGVRTTLWGGILLNVMLATVGIAGGFPIGILLALGRTSSFPVIRIPVTVFIELVRAGPLIAWLFLARFVLPSFMPSLLGLDELDIVVRAMIVLAAFTGVYIAEIVRGGLQGLPRGQVEAADALGLSTFQITTLIVLPQALRSVIPALVSQFISLWKDTTLVFGLSLFELLSVGEATLAQTDFIGRQTEVFLFVAFIFWTVAFTMSRLSARLETQLGIGAR
jgi:general L-amino acid transport system permease protein